MRIAAGIAGILLGLFSLGYVGIFGSMVGAAAGFLGSIPFQGNNLGGWAEMTKTLSWLSPLATIVGGIVTFANPIVGGIILGTSAFLHWQLLGLGLIGKLFVLPIGATAILALFAKHPTRSRPDVSVDVLAAAQLHGMPPATTQTPAPKSGIRGPDFDRAKWEALQTYDDEIAAVAKRLQSFDRKWQDEFAAAYLALNDKNYLSSIEQKIVAAANAAAKAEAERREQAANEEKERQERAAKSEAERQEQALVRGRQQQEAEKLERERLDLLKQQPREKVPLAVLGVVAAVVAVAGIAIGLIVWPKKTADTTIDSQPVTSQGASTRTVAQPQVATPQPGVGSPLGAWTYPHCTVEQLRNAERLTNAHGCPKQPSSQTEAPAWTANAAQDIANEFRQRGCPNAEASLTNAICNSVEFSCWSANTRQTTIVVKRACNDIHVTLADSNGVQSENRRYRLERNVAPQSVAGNPTEAVFAMIIASRNGDTAALHLARAKLDSFAKPVRGDRKVARDRNRLGLDALKGNNYDSAIARFSEGVAADPSDVEVKNNLGYALMMAGRLDDAKKALFESLLLDPARASAWANLGQTLAKQGDQDSATAAFLNTFIFSRAQAKTVEYLAILSESDPDPRVTSAARNAMQSPLMTDNKQMALVPREAHQSQNLNITTTAIVNSRVRYGPSASSDFASFAVRAGENVHVNAVRNGWCQINSAERMWVLCNALVEPRGGWTEGAGRIGRGD